MGERDQPKAEIFVPLSQQEYQKVPAVSVDRLQEAIRAGQDDLRKIIGAARPGKQATRLRYR